MNSMQQSNQIAARRFCCLAIRIFGKLGSVPLQQPTTLFSQALDRGCVELFLGVHTLVYVFSRSQVHQRRAHRSTEDLVVVCLRLLYLGGILSLAGAKLFGGKFMPAGAASPAFGWLRLSPIPRTMPCFVRRPKRQDQFTTALKTIPMHHIRSYHNEVRVRWSQLDISVRLKRSQPHADIFTPAFGNLEERHRGTGKQSLAGSR